MVKEDNSDFRFYIIIPAHNEEEYIADTLNSLVNQQFLPKKILIVDDHSSDKTPTIVLRFCEQYDFIDLLQIESSDAHIPGAKVVQAFNHGLQSLGEDYDVICKFDADIVFPLDYLKVLKKTFVENPRVGMAGGLCYIQEDGKWIYEPIADKSHLRGPIKAYRKECFKQIGGLTPVLGWDTLDQLSALYHDWKVKILPNLKVKHLRPTGQSYDKKANVQKGEVFYRLRYGMMISLIASAKAAWSKKEFGLFRESIGGYLNAKKKNQSFLIDAEQGQWTRKYRWKRMFKKLF